MLENPIPMKALLFLVLGAFVITLNSHAQSLSPAVISSSGAFYQNGSGMLSSTAGEMTMVETFSAGSNILTQGFQQAFDFNTGVQPVTENNFLNIFPNPSSGNLTILLPEGSTDETQIGVYDAIGKLVFRKKVPLNSLSKSIHLSLEELADGMYVFEVKTKTGKYFNKINIIK